MKLRLRSRLRLLSILQVNGLQSHFIGRKQMLLEECVCKNCGTHYIGNFCPNCGQSRKTRRLSMLHMIQDGLSLFTNLDNGILRTVSELFWRPGYMIRDYINGHRKGYMKPLSMLFCLSTLYYLFIWLVAKDQLPELNLGDGEIEINEEYAKLKPLLQMGKEYFQQWMSNPGLMVLTFIIPKAPATWLCFKRSRYGKVLNLMEHFHIQIFMACQNLVLIFTQAVFHWITMERLGFLDFNFSVSLLLHIWSSKQLFDLTWGKSFWLTILSFIVTFFNILLIIAFLCGLTVLYWFFW